MSGNWQQPIARIQCDGIVIGTGTVIRTVQDGPVLLTCAHVVNEYLNRDLYAEDRPDESGPIEFSLPFRSAGTLYNAKLLEWFPPRFGLARTDNPVSDIAVLKIEGQLPHDMRIVQPDNFKVAELDGTSVTGFGYSGDNGSFAFGKLLGTDGGGWLNFAAIDDLNKFIERGFSGAPLFDEGRKIILGMVVAVNEGEGRVAYAQPTEKIWRACPQVARPYKGLRDFEEADSQFFFGRDRFVDELYEKSKDCPIIGVSAPSGAGKSSIVKAGLIPRLRIDGRSLILQMRPGSDPWKALAQELAQLAHPERNELQRIDVRNGIYKKLRSDEQVQRNGVVIDYVQAALAHDGFADKILIYVDQFEELFTLAGHRNTRDDSAKEPAGPVGVRAHGENDHPIRDFRDLIADTAVLDGDVNIQWCYSIRADFVDKLIPHRAFVDCLGDGEIKLSEMTGHELRMAIRLPAEKLDVAFEKRGETDEDLSNRLADDAGKSAGSLPLLAHVLEQLWNGLTNREITHDAYDDLGGLGGALDKYAEGIAEKHFPKGKRHLLRRLFFRLIEPSESNEATRRVVNRDELGDEALWDAATVLADARLLIIRGGEGQPDSAEVAHEALINHWATLRKWIDENRGFIKWAKAFRIEYERWVEKDRDEGFILKGGGLDEASRRLRDWADFLNEDEIEFIRASEAVKIREDTEKGRQSARIRHLAYALAAIFIIVAIGFFALLEFNKQKNQADIDKSIFATAIADRLVEQGKYVTALLVLRDVLPNELSDDVRITKQIALTGLSGVFQAMHQDSSILRGHRAGIKNAEFSPDGSRIATASLDFNARIWDAATGRELAIMKGHKNQVYQASFSPDGGRIVTASLDKTARVWDVATGTVLLVLQGHEGPVFGAAFSPKGTRIVTVSRDATARIWDAATGRELLALQSQRGHFEHATFSVDGSRIVTASLDSTARIWDASTGQQLFILQGHDRAVFHAAFSPDGSRIVTSSMDTTARLWEASTGSELSVLEGHEDAVYRAAFSPDGNSILTSSNDKTARIWEASTGREKMVLAGHDGPISQAVFSPDGSRIVTASLDHTARLWDASDGRERSVLRGHENEIHHAAFSPDGIRIVTASLDSTARLWGAVTRRELSLLQGHENSVNHAEFSPDGDRIVTASNDNSARIWDASTGRQQLVLRGHGRDVLHATFSGDGSRIVTASLDSTARIWDASTGQELHVLRGHRLAIFHAAFSPNGNRIVTASLDATARIWEVSTGSELSVLEGHEGAVFHATFSPDGNSILTSSNDKTALIWEASTGHKQMVLTGHDGPVSHAAFSPDGSRIVTASFDRTARIWDAFDGSERSVLSGHSDTVTHVEFSPDSIHIVTASADRTARLWAASTGRELSVLRGHDGIIYHAAFSPDGSRIVTASDDSTVRLWDVSTGRKLTILEGHVGAVNHAAFSPDGMRIVTVSSDNSVRTKNVVPAELSGAESGRALVHKPISQRLLNRVFGLYPYTLNCDERREILKEFECQ